MIIRKKLIKSWKLTLPVLLIACSSAQALNDVENSKIQNTVTQNTQNNIGNHGAAKDWNLNDGEWTTYQNLMQGQAGIYYQNLTPPEVLGHYAESDIERRHYAEIYAKLEHEKIERELAFDKEFHEAALRLYGNEPVIKPFDITHYSPIPKNVNNKASLQAGDHLVYFVDPAKPNVSHTLDDLISKINQNAGVVLDIFFVDIKNISVIQQWSKNNQIPVGLVNASRITLNKDSGNFRKIAGSNGLPTLMLVRDGKSKLVDAEAL